MLRLAIIGAGWAGERQAQAIRELNSDVTIACLVDNDQEFLRTKATELGIETTCPDLHVILADDRVDAVSICTPHRLHAPMAIAAAEAGKHVLVEKPIALDVAEAERMIDAADANGVKLYVAENLCYTPVARFLRDVVQSGEFVGELVAASLVWGFRAPNFGYPGRRAWLTQPDLGGTGTWMLHGIHTMAQLRYIFGEVAEIYLREHHGKSFERPDIEGTMTGILTLENGLHITLIQSCETQTQARHSLGGYTLYGSDASLRAWQSGYEVFERDEAPRPLPYPPSPMSEYALEIKAFADYVLRDQPGPTDGRSERRSLAVVQAGYESAAQQHPIRLAERFGTL
jgi:UDP-N-acetyl-2-amino-2-deoxyglucuronate dehydrogenase